MIASMGIEQYSRSRRVARMAGLFTASLLMLGLSVNAGSLTTNPVVQIGNGGDHNVSVYPGKAAYDGLVSGVFGDGTVLDYRFVNNETLLTGGYANGGEEYVSTFTPSGGLTDYEMYHADVWTSTDPGPLSGGIPDFSSTADVGGTNNTMSGQTVMDGTIDVSKLSDGRVYVLCGSYDSFFTVSLTMSGVGQTNLMVSTVVDPPPNRNKYVIEFDFENPSHAYDSVAFNYTGSAGNRARFMGVVLDGTPPPQGTVITLY
jgi:hypothetical protein